MNLFDFHIHTRFSSCCKCDYGYLDVQQRVKELGLSGFGVSDHSTYSKTDLEHVLLHRKAQQASTTEPKGLVGMEISIFNQRGKLGVYPKALPLLDYIIIAEHIHVAKPFSGYFTFQARMMKLIENYPLTEHKINNELDRLLAMELAAIKQHPRSILAHLLRFPVHRHFVPPKVFEMTEKILEALQTYNVALEIHSSFLSGYQMDKAAADAQKRGTDANLRDFFHNLAHRVKFYSIPYSIGSDAHNLAHIHSAETWRTFFQLAGLDASRLITPAFFIEN